MCIYIYMYVCMIYIYIYMYIYMPIESQWWRLLLATPAARARSPSVARSGALAGTARTTQARTETLTDPSLLYIAIYEGKTLISCDHPHVESNDSIREASDVQYYDRTVISTQLWLLPCQPWTPLVDCRSIDPSKDIIALIKTIWNANFVARWRSQLWPLRKRDYLIDYMYIYE